MFDPQAKKVVQRAMDCPACGYVVGEYACTGCGLPSEVVKAYWDKPVSRNTPLAIPDKKVASQEAVAVNCLQPTSIPSESSASSFQRKGDQTVQCTKEPQPQVNPDDLLEEMGVADGEVRVRRRR